MSILFYRRPSYVQRPNGPITNLECQRYVDRTTGGTRGIPEELSFENVIGNKALPVRPSVRPLKVLNVDRQIAVYITRLHGLSRLCHT